MENFKEEDLLILMRRINKLISFLDGLDDGTFISAGDTLGFIHGYFGEESLAEDEIDCLSEPIIKI